MNVPTHPHDLIHFGDCSRVHDHCNPTVRPRGFHLYGYRAAAVHQAANHAAAAHSRGVRADAAGRAVHSVHLRDRPADPNSPFAKLAALKDQLAANRKD